MRHVLLLSASALLLACGGPLAETRGLEGTTTTTQDGVEIVTLEKKTKELQETAEKLEATRATLEDQSARLTRICTDYPDHDVCKPQTQAQFAKAAFCSDKTFTAHVDEIVNACHQGQCKQVDDAQLLMRVQYMTLVQSLPHTLVLFGNAQTGLDTVDRKQLQKFIEVIHANEGYVIIVGRASQDGAFKQNLRLALDRAENTRKFMVDTLGLSDKQVGYITYGHPKMYLTELDAERLANRKVSVTQGNRSALVFAYPCRSSKPGEPPAGTPGAH